MSDDNCSHHDSSSNSGYSHSNESNHNTYHSSDHNYFYNMSSGDSHDKKHSDDHKKHQIDDLYLDITEIREDLTIENPKRTSPTLETESVPSGKLLYQTYNYGSASNVSFKVASQNLRNEMSDRNRKHIFCLMVFGSLMCIVIGVIMLLYILDIIY